MRQSSKTTRPCPASTSRAKPWLRRWGQTRSVQETELLLQSSKQEHHRPRSVPELALLIIHRFHITRTTPMVVKTTSRLLEAVTTCDTTGWTKPLLPSHKKQLRATWEEKTQQASVGGPPTHTRAMQTKFRLSLGQVTFLPSNLLWQPQRVIDRIRHQISHSLTSQRQWLLQRRPCNLWSKAVSSENHPRIKRTLTTTTVIAIINTHISSCSPNPARHSGAKRLYTVTDEQER